MNNKVKELWVEFGDIPMNPNTECIEVEWNGFPSGTHREEIWEWFEGAFNIRVYDLMYGLTEVEDALLEELYSYTVKEYNDEILSEKERSRYVEIVDTLKAKDVEIPFGIEI